MRVLMLLAIGAGLMSGLAESAPVPKSRPVGDWPQWRGPNRDAISPTKGLLAAWPMGGPKLLWSIEDPNTLGVGYSSLAVVGSRVIVMGCDPPSGEEKTTDEYCTCLRTTDGGKIWRSKLGVSRSSDSYGAGPASTPTVDGDSVYALSSAGELCCLALSSGEIRWRRNLPKDFDGAAPSFGYAESPLVDGPLVVVSPGGKAGLVALEKTTGKTVWQCQGKQFGEGAGYSSAVIAEVGGVRQYIRQAANAAVGVRATDGKLLWSLSESDRELVGIGTAVIQGDLVFFSTTSDKRGGSCFKLEKDSDGTKATKVYSNNNVLANYHGGVVAVGEHLYGHSERGNQWVCFPFTRDSKQPTWSAKCVGKGSVIFADGHLYCYGAVDGSCVLVPANSKTYSEKGQLKLPSTSQLRPKDGGIFTLPALAGGRLFLRDYEKLFVYDVAR